MVAPPDVGQGGAGRRAEIKARDEGPDRVLVPGDEGGRLRHGSASLGRHALEVDVLRPAAVAN